MQTGAYTVCTIGGQRVGPESGLALPRRGIEPKEIVEITDVRLMYRLLRA